MPRNVRNFWIEVDAGHRSISTGPRRADEGIDVRIYLRECGGVSSPIRLAGRVHAGRVMLDAQKQNGEWITLAEYER